MTTIIYYSQQGSATSPIWANAVQVLMKISSRKYSFLSWGHKVMFKLVFLMIQCGLVRSSFLVGDIHYILKALLELVRDKEIH